MSRRRQHSGPIWARPEPGERRPRFTREQLAEAALAVADAEGIEAVSMRRIAAELGAGTMTLYHYVRTKDDLLALMDDAFMRELLVPDGELPPDDWRSAMTAIARSSRAAAQRHPWALNFARESAFGPNAMRHFEQSLAAVAGTGLPPVERIRLITILDDYVFGYVIREARDVAHDEAWGELISEFVERELSSGDYPSIEGLFGGRPPSAAAWSELAAEVDASDRFELGLRCLLDGIALELARRGDEAG